MGHIGMRYSLPSRELIADCVETVAAAHWLDVLSAASIPCALVENVESVAAGDVADEYAAFSAVVDSEGREMRYVRNPIADLEIKESAAPTLGQHSEAILRELGYADAEIESLVTP